MPKKLRSCLRLAAALCTLALVAAALRPEAPDDNPEKPIRVAIVGLVHGHIQGFLSSLPKNTNFELVAVVEPDTALAQRYATRFHLDSKLFFTDTDRMLDQQHTAAVLV